MDGCRPPPSLHAHTLARFRNQPSVNAYGGALVAQATASFQHIHSWGRELNTFMIGSTATLTTFHAWYHYTPSYRGRVARYPAGSREWLSANDDRCRGRWPGSPR